MLYGIGCDLCEHRASGKKPYRRTRCSLYPPGVRRGRTRCAEPDEPLPAGRSAAHRLASAAANFAAKEAFLKAAGTGLREPFSCVRSRLSGWKAVHLPIIFPARRRNGCRPRPAARLSLSHDGGMALAFCTLETL